MTSLTHVYSRGTILFVVLLLTLSVYESAAHSHHRRRFGKVLPAKLNQSLTVNLYYESLCPDCMLFIGSKLCPLWEENMSQYFKIDFVPYGNAETTVSNKTGEISIECQHGPAECEANMIHACALKHLSYKQSIRFICCMESRHSAPGSGEICAEDLEVDYDIIKTCAEGDEGIQLHHAYGQRTDKLLPKHEWVPWILFNEHYDEADMDQAEKDLVGVICKYLADPKPSQCNEVY